VIPTQNHYRLWYVRKLPDGPRDTPGPLRKWAQARPETGAALVDSIINRRAQARTDWRAVEWSNCLNILRHVRSREGGGALLKHCMRGAVEYRETQPERARTYLRIVCRAYKPHRSIKL
jgi:hypothetical protein